MYLANVTCRNHTYSAGLRRIQQTCCIVNDTLVMYKLCSVFSSGGGDVNCKEADD